MYSFKLRESFFMNSCLLQMFNATACTYAIFAINECTILFNFFKLVAHEFSISNYWRT